MAQILVHAYWTIPDHFLVSNIVSFLVILACSHFWTILVHQKCSSIQHLDIPVSGTYTFSQRFFLKRNLAFIPFSICYEPWSEGVDDITFNCYIIQPVIGCCPVFSLIFLYSRMLFQYKVLVSQVVQIIAT